MNASRDLAPGLPGTALGLECTRRTVLLAGVVDKRVLRDAGALLRERPSVLLEELAAWTGVGVRRRTADQLTSCAARCEASAYPAFTTAGGSYVPFMMEGGVVFGQYRRIVSANGAAGAGSQFDCLSLPGNSCWK